MRASHRRVVAGTTCAPADHTCSLPSIRVATSNGSDRPLGTRPLVDLLRELDPAVAAIETARGATPDRPGAARFAADRWGPPLADSEALLA